MQFKVNSK